MSGKIAQIELQKNALYVVKDGKIKLIEAPPTGFGKQTVCWQNGSPTHVDYSYSRPIK